MQVDQGQADEVDNVGTDVRTCHGVVVQGFGQQCRRNVTMEV